MNYISIWIIKGYQIIIAPLLPPSCRFYPSCSQYAIETLNKYNVFKSLLLIGWRILRCNPWNPGGYDPVP
ncbi:membrane protein insertion efficiency factor YidD [candidate division KSB1 bacterium]|nr:membrane protein insertion efficiency factor YidD [bacterium]RKY78403.1 MAG: membrane protein insertion efficiency factor YidD [candidate division KSB1 bacterium]RKY80819.1 MAG: membrane protein insertion efficiency factor YidD [candidate division KSB1 bacterium]RKY84739.1 MAG: membrane protein insertion efficiency factor YidD [candidate division KSB1 bacterium]RKY88927.1 MAG: membrane protein insertion efficiency factor YidD [candidate division KSB1 bacterium]